MLTGVGISGIALLIAGRTEDHLIEITLTTIAAYASFLVAEHFHASGVIAALTAGLGCRQSWLNGHYRRRDRPYVEFFLGICRFPRELPDLHSHWNEHSQPAAAQTRNFTAVTAIVLVLFSRLASIYPLALLFRGSRWRLPMRYRHTLFGAGLGERSRSRLRWHSLSRCPSAASLSSPRS